MYGTRLATVHNVVLTLALDNAELGFSGGDPALQHGDEEEHGAGQEDHDARKVETSVVVADRVVQSTWKYASYDRVDNASQVTITICKTWLIIN